MNDRDLDRLARRSAAAVRERADRIANSQAAFRELLTREQQIESSWSSDDAPSWGGDQRPRGPSHRRAFAGFAAAAAAIVIAAVVVITRGDDSVTTTETPTSSSTPHTTVPQTTVPPRTVPQTTVPQTTVPQTTVLPRDTSTPTVRGI